MWVLVEVWVLVGVWVGRCERGHRLSAAGRYACFGAPRCVSLLLLSCCCTVMSRRKQGCQYFINPLISSTSRHVQAENAGWSAKLSAQRERHDQEAEALRRKLRQEAEEKVGRSVCWEECGSGGCTGRG